MCPLGFAPGDAQAGGPCVEGCPMRRLLGLLCLTALAACGAGPDGDEGDPSLEGDGLGTLQTALDGDVPVGTLLQTTAGLALRSGPTYSYPAQVVMPRGSFVRSVERPLP